jgi:starvation-inducible DNA-binding protein
MTEHKTHNDTDSNAKKVSTELLNARVADGIDLALITKQAHWNLRGRQFIGIHEMLDKLRGDMDEYNDTMAERVVQLGGIALGTSQILAKKSTIKPYPTEAATIDEHLKALIERYGQFANDVRKNIDDTDDAGDSGTSDLFTEVSRGVDKWLWFLEAHVEK